MTIRITMGGEDVTEQIVHTVPVTAGNIEPGRIVTNDELTEMFGWALMRRGPFINDLGDVWVPATVGGIGQAWRVAKETDYEMRFAGMVEATMSLHEADNVPEPEEVAFDHVCSFPAAAQPCTWTARAYHFEVRDD